MSLKLIEMQIALPRTQDIGKIQEQLQQKSQISQNHLEAETKKETERLRTKLMESEQSGKTKLDNNSKDGNSHQQSSTNKKKTNKKQIYQSHPYKGTLFDLEG